MNTEKNIEINIPYGENDTITINIPQERIAGILYPKDVEKKDENSEILKALDKPLNSKNFDEFLSDAKELLIIVNDGTRPTPTAKILGAIADRLRTHNIKFIVATGSHREPTQEEFRQIFGNFYDELKNYIYVHDAKNSEMQYLGDTKRKTPVYINKMALDAHKIIIIGSIEPHYFAGYTGGRKAFLPGIASYKTIEANHKHALMPEAKTLTLEGNPVHEDMMEVLSFFKNTEIFSIMSVLDSSHNIYSVIAGDIKDSFFASVEKANDVYCIPVKEKADIVLAVAPFPMDIDLYQSQKAIEHGKLALKEGGILILVSKCRSGIGPQNFVALLKSCDCPEKVMEKIYKEYLLGYHKAAKISEMTLKSEIWAVTDIDDSIIKSIFITPFKSLQEAINEAFDKKDADKKIAKILILPMGSVTIPLI